jgi:molybdopterin-containing oxidoreductase family iron-sulfur binding subunit
MQNNTSQDVVWGNLDRCEWGIYPEASRCYLPHACMQCDYPACVAKCPTGASYKGADGVTLVDYKTCIGCGICVEACPYGARILNRATRTYFGAKKQAPYEAYGVQRTNVAEKCIFCHDLVEQGGMPACVVNCPGKARTFGDIEDPQSDIAKKAANAKRIDESGFYYLEPAGIPAGMILSKVTLDIEPLDAKGPVVVKEAAESKKAAAGIDPVPIGIGAAVVVAAGVGAGVAVKSKRKKAEQKGDGNNAE